MNEPDWDAIRARIETAKQQPEFSDTDTEPEPETYDQIRQRMFDGDTLPDIAARMFRH